MWPFPHTVAKKEPVDEVVARLNTALEEQEKAVRELLELLRTGKDRSIKP